MTKTAFARLAPVTTAAAQDDPQTLPISTIDGRSLDLHWHVEPRTHALVIRVALDNWSMEHALSRENALAQTPEAFCRMLRNSDLLVSYDDAVRLRATYTPLLAPSNTAANTLAAHPA